MNHSISNLDPSGAFYRFFIVVTVVVTYVVTVSAIRFLTEFLNFLRRMESSTKITSK
jgi:hypothetical protein